MNWMMYLVYSAIVIIIMAVVIVCIPFIAIGGIASFLADRAMDTGDLLIKYAEEKGYV